MGDAGEEEQDESTERVHCAQSYDADQSSPPQHLLHTLQDPLPRHRHQEVRHTLPPPSHLPTVSIQCLPVTLVMCLFTMFSHIGILFVVIMLSRIWFLY